MNVRDLYVIEMGSDGYTGVFTTYTGVQPQLCEMIGTRVLVESPYFSLQLSI